MGRLIPAGTGFVQEPDGEAALDVQQSETRNGAQPIIVHPVHPNAAPTGYSPLS